MRLTCNTGGLKVAGVPSSYELQEWVNLDLLLNSGVRPEQVVEAAKSQRILEGLSVTLPPTVSESQALDLLGVDREMWRWLLRKTQKRSTRRELMKWETVAVSMVGDSYWGPDILRLGSFLDAHCWERSLSVVPALVGLFSEQVSALLSKLRAKVQIARVPASQPPSPVLVKTPVVESKPPVSGAILPRDNKELARLYSRYVEDQVRRASKNKSTEELREVTQHIWCCLIESKVLTKFVEAAKTRLPRTLTLAESLGYLGISQEQWVATEQQSIAQQTWFPKPVSGKAGSAESLYLTAEIETLQVSSLWPQRGPSRMPDVGVRGFKSYLAQAVRNHFKNLLRTRLRRHKERCMDSRVVLSESPSGTYSRVMTLEESSSNWEDHMTSPDLPMEDMLDLVAEMRMHEVNPHTEWGLEVLDGMVTRGQTVRGVVRAQNRQAVA